jgi:hypothetical protein
MRVLACVMGDETSERGVQPTTEDFDQMSRFNQQLIDAGILLAGDGLRPTSDGAKLKWTGEGPTVIDGPFAESKEVVAGFWIVEVASLDEAKEWFSRCPCGPGAEIQLRPVYELDDFDTLGPEARRISEQVRTRRGS